MLTTAAKIAPSSKFLQSSRTSVPGHLGATMTTVRSCMDKQEDEQELPSGNLTWLLKMAIEIVDFPIKNGDFPISYVSLPEGNQRSFRIYKEPNRNDANSHAIACSCCLLVSAFHFCDNDWPMSLSGSSGPVYIQLRRTRSYLERVRVRASGIEPQFEC